MKRFLAFTYGALKRGSHPWFVRLSYFRTCNREEFFHHVGHYFVEFLEFQLTGINVQNRGLVVRGNPLAKATHADYLI